MSRKRQSQKPTVDTKPFITRQQALICLLLALCTLAIYWQVYNFQFVRYDDGDYIFNNQNIRSGINPASIKWAFSMGGYAANWHPLTWISHIVDYQLYGLSPGGHHVTSVIIHILSTLILFLALSRMTGSVWRSAFVAALFAIHPVHAESVAWVSERKDVLSTFFWMLTLMAYAFYVERKTTARYLTVLGLYVLGLMAKPMLVTLPIVLLLLDWWPLGRFKEQVRKRSSSPAWKTLVIEKAPFFLLVVASSIITVIVQHKGGAVQGLKIYPLSVRIDNAVVAYMSYIGKTIWPARLAVFYPHPGMALPVLSVIGSAIALLGIAFAGLKLGKNCPYLGVGLLWFFITLIPVIGLVQVGWQAMADRYTYVPVIGLFIIVAWGAPDLAAYLRSRRHVESEAGTETDVASEPEPQRKHDLALIIPAVAVIGGLMIVGFQQVATWKTNFTLFEHALATNMNNRLAAINLGCNFADIGQFDDAARMLGQALKVYPGDSYAQCNYANALVHIGKIDEALMHYRKAIEIKKNSDLAYSGLGRALYEKNDMVGAEAACRKAIKLSDKNPHAHNNLGMVLGKQGQLDRAEAEFREAVRLKPDFPEALTNIGIVMIMRGRIDAAVDQYNEAIKHDPKFVPAHSRLAEAMYNLADYAGSWTEVHKIRELGGAPNPQLIQALSEKRPDPFGK